MTFSNIAMISSVGYVGNTGSRLATGVLVLLKLF